MGTYPGSNGKSFQSIAKRCLDNVARGNATMDVFDPVMGNGCVTATESRIAWHPIKPATNAAFALGIVQWILDNNAHNAEFLSYPSYQAAWDGGFASCTNATHLVIVDESHPNYRKIMRPADAGMNVPEQKDKDGKAVDQFVVIDASTNQPAVHTACTQGALEYEGEVNGVAVRTAFLFLKDSAYEHTMDEYSQITGIPVETIENVAREFTSHGVKAAATTGFGGTALANGLTSVHAQRILNAMIGSDQMVGGMMVRRIGAKTTTDGARYLLSTVKGTPNVSTKNATYISRTNRKFSATDEYKNRVAAGETDPKPKLPWINISSGSDNQALVSIVNQYPYQAKIVLSWMVDTLQATSGALREPILEKLRDPSVVPLHIACDAFIGEHAQVADYIVPDTIPFESFGIVTQEGHWKGKGNTVRWPAKNPETIEISGGRHASYEAFLIDIAEVCNLPGFGEDAISGTDGTLYPLHDACDYFLKGIANLAYDVEPVADIDQDEIHLQALDQLPESWKAAVSAEEWPKVLNVLSRGGRFWPVEESMGDGGRSAYAKESCAYFYSEAKALNTNDYTGRNYNGTLRHEPETLIDQTLLSEKYPETEWPLRSVNYKPRFRTISMLANSPIMRDLCSHNYLEINEEDAVTFGVKDGDTIRIVNPTGDVMEGEAMVRAGVAKGTFAVAYGYGHLAYGAQDINIEGEQARPGDPAIGAGIHLQTMLDPSVDALFPLVDPEAGSPGRSGGVYKIEKA